MAGVLGAVVLAVVQLHRARRKDRERISLLSAELAAHRIATLHADTAPAPAASPGPAQRRRHLTLHRGSKPQCVEAFADEASHLWREHRTASATLSIATSAAVAGALILTGGSGSTSGETLPDSTPSSTPGHGDDVPSASAPNCRIPPQPAEP
ncbi:hypothetical protein [Streptomyces bacillaris]|uniref:hypothetical protein n=1 Tax=Streptomyces bacillaris TaxID=68179 RepID=UPI00362C6B45